MFFLLYLLFLVVSSINFFSAFNHNSKMKKVYTPRPSGGSLRKTSGALKSTKKSSNVAKVHGTGLKLTLSLASPN